MSVINAEKIRVAIVGGGIAGLTAALRLAERDYAVTLYEAKETLGGNLSSQQVDGVYHDVYPHMFCEWYQNFWTLFESDLGRRREHHFKPEKSIKLLRKGSTEYIELKNAVDLASLWSNLRSGLQPFPDMFLYGYAMIDMAAHEFDPKHLLNRNTINGFLYSQYYTSERSAEMFDFYLREIWSVNGSRTSVRAYQKFSKHTLRLSGSMPFAWLLKGSLQEQLIAPLAAKLRALGCAIRTQAAVTAIDLVPASGAARSGTIRLALIPEGGARSEPGSQAAGDSGPLADEHDYVILAVPPEALARLVQSGSAGARIVERLPQLTEVRRLRAEPIPVVDLYFKRKLTGLPREHVALSGSSTDLTVLDISELWTDDPNMRECTALILAASNFYALPSQTPTKEQDGYLMVKTLHEYLPQMFDCGEYWGDPHGDIDWSKSNFRTNLDYRLYINEVGNSQWCPQSAYDELPNVFFAGDYCDNPIAMASVEGAVLSGLQAAQSLWRRCPRGTAIEIAELDAVSQSRLLAAKLALGPSAYWAKAWSLALEAAPKVAKGDYSTLPKTAAMILRLPSAYAGEFLNTAYNLVESVVSKRLRKRQQ